MVIIQRKDRVTRGNLIAYLLLISSLQFIPLLLAYIYPQLGFPKRSCIWYSVGTTLIIIISFLRKKEVNEIILDVSSEMIYFKYYMLTKGSIESSFHYSNISLDYFFTRSNPFSKEIISLVFISSGKEIFKIKEGAKSFTRIDLSRLIASLEKDK